MSLVSGSRRLDVVYERNARKGRHQSLAWHAAIANFYALRNQRVCRERLFCEDLWQINCVNVLSLEELRAVIL